ncbi:MAG: ABC transporter permease [Acidobacteriota bacterium]
MFDVFKKIVNGATNVLHKDRVERDLDQEVRFHLEMEVQQNIRRGMTPSEARLVALRSFGGVEQVKEQCRDEKGGRFLETLLQDVRYGARVLTKNPAFTLVALVTLALGIGANTAIFSVIYGVLMRPLPYQDGSSLVVLHQLATRAAADNQNLAFSVKEIADYREHSQTLDGVAEHHTMSFILLGREEPERVSTAVVSANFFDLLGVQPLLGRTFLPEDDQKGADAVLVLSHKYWRENHGADPNIVGRVFTLNDRPHTVIGVLPPIPQYPVESDVYMPTVACPTRSSDRVIANRNFRMMSVFARLKSGVTADQATADLSLIASNLRKEYPDSYPESRGYDATAALLKEELTQNGKPTFLILLATAGLVLLIACANVANLTLARLMRREREMAIRAALGAGKARLIRQLLTESTLLSLAGGALGLLLAAGGLRLLVTFAARFTTRASEIHIDAGVLLFTLLVSVATGLAFGLMPAFSSEQNLTSALKEGSGRTTSSKRRQRARSVLIVAQVAISFMLLIGAGLMVRSLIKLQQVNPGFSPESVLLMRISPNWSKHTTHEQHLLLNRRLLEKAQAQPGALSVAIASTFPLNPLGITFGPFNRRFQIEGQPIAANDPGPEADIRIVSPDYFQTIRLPLVSGRTFSEQDKDKALPIAVINRSMSRHRFGDDDPVGKRVTFDRGDTWVTIVGIVGDVKQYGLGREASDELYTPLEQGSGGGNLLVRTATDPMSMAALMRETIHEVDPEIAIDNVQTLELVRSESLASPRLTAVLLGLFAALALVITAAGIAGVMALSVSQRTHELGVRMALGATSARVMAMVMRQGMTLVVAGIVVGVAGALALAQLMSALLFSVGPSDPLTFLAVAVVLIAVAAVSCFLPARRVTTIDPMIALRSE